MLVPKTPTLYTIRFDLASLVHVSYVSLLNMATLLVRPVKVTVVTVDVHLSIKTFVSM